MIHLGVEAKDMITGFSGIVTARVEYLNGCIQCCIKPKKVNKNGEMIDGEYFDVGQLQVIGKGVVGKTKKWVEELGGPQSDTPRTTYNG